MKLWKLLVIAVVSRAITWWRDRRERRRSDEHYGGRS